MKISFMFLAIAWLALGASAQTSIKTKVSLKPNDAKPPQNVLACDITGYTPDDKTEFQILFYKGKDKLGWYSYANHFKGEEHHAAHMFYTFYRLLEDESKHFYANEAKWPNFDIRLDPETMGSDAADFSCSFIQKGVGEVHSDGTVTPVDDTTDEPSSPTTPGTPTDQPGKPTDAPGTLSVQLTSTATKVEETKEFTLKCAVSGYKPDAKKKYTVGFTHNGAEIASFDYKEHNGEAARVFFELNPAVAKNISVSPGDQIDIPSFWLDVTVKHLSGGEESFACYFLADGVDKVVSKPWPAKAGGDEITAKLSSSVTKVELNKEFTLKCEITGYKSDGKAPYSVVFTRNGKQFCSFVFKEHGNEPAKIYFELNTQELTEISVSPGEHIALPTFEIEVKPKHSTEGSYGCVFNGGHANSNEWHPGAR